VELAQDIFIWIAEMAEALTEPGVVGGEVSTLTVVVAVEVP